MGVIVLTYGTFDLFHYGHYRFLKRAKALGDYLYVGISTDEFCKLKGKKTLQSQEERLEMVSDLRFVDKTFYEFDMKQKVNDAIQFNASIFVLGSDYSSSFLLMPEYNELLKINVKTVFLTRTPNISSSMLRNRIESKG